MSGTGEKLNPLWVCVLPSVRGRLLDLGPGGHVHGWGLQAVQRGPGLSSLDCPHSSLEKYHCRWGTLSQGSQTHSWLMMPVQTCPMGVLIQDPDFS